METNAKLMTVALLIATLASPFAHAQTQAGAGDPPPRATLNMPSDAPQPGGPGHHHFKHGNRPDQRGGRPDQQGGRPDRFGRNGGPGWGGRSQGLTSLTTVSGTVGQWTGNDDDILDGFTLNAGSNAAATTIKFPPHLGQQVQKAIKPGATVSVTGYSETTRQGETRFRMNSLSAGKITVFDAPPTRPTTVPEPPALTTATGKITDYRLDREARVNGLVLDDKMVVMIPSHVAYQLTNLAKKGSTITVQGYPRNLREGQVQLEKTTVLRASVLTINGQQYLVR